MHNNKIIINKQNKNEKNKIIYWVTTGIIRLMMMFSAFSYLSNLQIMEAFKHPGFPSYFRVELALAKIIGAVVLIIPAIPARIKEWAYAGFGITFISAAIAHFNSGDPVSMISMPLIFLVILVASNIYLHKTIKNKTISTEQLSPAESKAEAQMAL